MTSHKQQQQQCAVCECIEESCEPCKYPERCSNCSECCCTQSHVTWRQERIREGLRLEYFSVGWMSIEVIGSLAAGILASSFALIAFGADSLVEIMSAIVVLRHLRLDSAGSRLLGERTALFTSFLLMAIVPLLGVGSTYSFFVLRIQPEASLIGIAIASGAILIMPYLWMKKKRIGQDTGCLPLTIDAIESATCFLMSAALLTGLALEYIFRIGWFDYLATIVILAFVAFEAKESFAEARAPPQN